MEMLLAFLPISLMFVFYIVPIIFIVWFLLKFLKIQQDMVQVLKAIADKLDNTPK